MSIVGVPGIKAPAPPLCGGGRGGWQMRRPPEEEVTVCLNAMGRAFPATDSLQRTTKPSRLMAVMKLDPERAAQLRAHSQEGFRGIAKRLWPHLLSRQLLCLIISEFVLV
ncbi:hypothetical protein VZT92_001049 [Zoarces viviparus]|uniref:Uncharacterized protein n=1 Tax=Zoarces viviparus TaxID=48416 RepID=A0AAW1G7E7_ZOAVI